VSDNSGDVYAAR